MKKRIFITGIGLISAIGKDTTENLKALQKGAAGLAAIRYLNSKHRGTIPVCEVKYSKEELYQLANIAPSKAMSRTALLGIIAAQEACEMAKTPALDNGRTAVISATTVGGMDTTEHFYADFLADAQSGDVELMRLHECADSTEQIANKLGASGPIATISTACSSATNAILLGARMLQNGLADRAIVGGTDALSKFTINGFQSLQILDKKDCQPFDQNRRGLNLGEGAAFLVLEIEGVAKTASILGELVGYANANDAYHQTASSPNGQGAYLAIKGALAKANISPEAIDYINAHGTGTQNNDLSEVVAMQRIFGDKMPPFSSTKAYTGHTLAAAGAIEAVFSLLSLQTQTIFPNLRFETPIKDLKKPLKPVTSVLENQNLNYILSNSFGFGGNTSSLVFAKYLAEEPQN